MAAKALQISDDAGSNWYTLPGPGASFNSEGEAIDDTILGASFKSAITGLLNWTMEGSAIFKGYAGYLCDISKHGTSTTFTTEACTLVSGKTYKITDGTKNIWDRTATLNVFDNGVNHNADVIDIDYLFGRVTFAAGYTVTGPVTVTGKYYPRVQLAKGQSFTLTQTADMIDKTDFGTAQANGGRRVFQPGLREVGLEVQGFFDATSDFLSLLEGRNEFIIEIDPIGDQLSMARGFFRLMNQGRSGDVGALEQETLRFSLNVPVQTKLTNFFKWNLESNTVMPTAVQKIVTAWQNETSLSARYLPQGSTGQSPLDGAAGTVYMSDISLASGLSAVNRFNATMQGSGAITIV